MNKINKLAAVVCVMTLAAGALLPEYASAQQMRVSSFEPQNGFHSKLLQEWIDEMNAKLSDGASFRLYPASMLGSPVAQAELVKNGVADVALVVPTYTPGVFPLTSVVEVPTIAPTASHGMGVLNTLYEEALLSEEYDDYKVIAFWTTPGYRIFSSSDPIIVPEDMQGKRLRTPSPFGTELLQMAGASGIPVPAPQVYENIERNVVDGAIWTMDAYSTFRLDEVAPQVTRTRLMATPMTILMNKNTYSKLSEENRDVIDSLTLRERSAWASDKVDAFEDTIENNLLSNSDVNFFELTAEQEAEWVNVFSTAVESWMRGKPATAQNVIDRAMELAEQ